MALNYLKKGVVELSKYPEFVPERVRKPISDAELERRWKLVRGEMKKEGIDCLVLQNDHRYRSGMVRYLTDIGNLSNPVSVVFPVEDEMTVFSNGGGYSLSQTPAYGCRGVKDRIGVPLFPTYVAGLCDADARGTVEIIKKRGDKKVGVVRISTMLGGFYKYLTENLPGVELVEFTNQIDEIKAVKSPEEIAFIRHTAKVQDYVMEAVRSYLRPGIYEYELRGFIIHLLSDLGSEEQLIMLGSAPLGQKAGHTAHYYQNRRIEAGDNVMVMLEPNGPGGYWTELGRTFILGEPTPLLQEVWNDALKAQYYTAELCKPGATGAEVYEKYNQYLEKNGYAKETRIHAHGQGYDLMERPGIRGEDPMVIKPGMNLAIHPTLAKEGAYIFCCDNFLTTEAKPERVHTNPQELFVIDC
ncbi:MAG: M24 family metallopeptidase [Gracilibacteraceae bacterium]|jgi:Xaa-Pro aminopeptidase|nr:M24 family metallopeptidase [Gracilibacteraceae bacterium]